MGIGSKDPNRKIQISIHSIWWQFLKTTKVATISLWVFIAATLVIFSRKESYRDRLIKRRFENPVGDMEHLIDVIQRLF
jgi:hypothetical protein